jgi:hypothetical protein
VVNQDDLLKSERLEDGARLQGKQAPGFNRRHCQVPSLGQERCDPFSALWLPNVDGVGLAVAKTEDLQRPVAKWGLVLQTYLARIPRCR